jgi:hypothetical protein
MERWCSLYDDADEDDAPLVCTPEALTPPRARVGDVASAQRPDGCAAQRSTGACSGDDDDDATYAPSRAELRCVTRALGSPCRAVTEFTASTAACATDVAARRALTKRARTPYEHLTNPSDYAQLERMLAHWGLTFPPGFDAAVLAARFALHPAGVTRVNLKLPTCNADGDVCETASIDDLRRGKSIHLTVAERAAMTRRRAEANRVVQPPGSRLVYETERVGIELFMRIVGHADDAVQLLEHRLFDAAVPVGAAVQASNHGGAAPGFAPAPVRYAAFAFKTSHVKAAGSFTVVTSSWLAYLERGGAVAVVAYEPGAAQPRTVCFVPPTAAAMAWCRAAVAGPPSGVARASLSLSPHGDGRTAWRASRAHSASQGA